MSTVVLLRKDVAANYYHGTWDAAIAAAEAQADGVQLAPATDAKGNPRAWAHETPEGWAVFRQKPKSDRVWLHFQNY